MSGEELLTLSGHTAEVYDVAFSPDGMRLATAGHDGRVSTWDATTGERLWTRYNLSSLHENQAIFALAFSLDGTRLVTRSENVAKVWDAVSGWRLGRLIVSGVTWGVAFSPDGEYLAISREDGATGVWDITSEVPHLLVTLGGHVGVVSRVAFSPDGTRLATAGWDGTVKMWDVEASVVAGSGQELLTLSVHTGSITGLAFNPDGTRLATSSFDGTTRVYTLKPEELVALAQSRVTRSLTDEECQQYLHVDQCPDSP
jgi:WD40 repeat protein